MARIRTVKPELFRHEALFEAERDTGLPLRLSFIGLFTCCDREGRFRWLPRSLKLDVLPHDQIDFSRVLDALLTRGFIVKYGDATGEYGCIPTFLKHQVINNRERDSDLPALADKLILVVDYKEELTRAPRVLDACATPALPCTRGREGKGREQGRGTGKEVEGNSAPSGAVSKGGQVWESYSREYQTRYGVTPVRNAKVNSQINQIVDRLGPDDAPQVAAFFVHHNASWYVSKGHAIGLLLADAEKLRTEWATGRRVTGVQARQVEKTQANLDSHDEALKILESKGYAL